MTEDCESELGLESGTLPDSAFSASSSYDKNNVGPQNARLVETTNPFGNIGLLDSMYLIFQIKVDYCSFND